MTASPSGSINQALHEGWNAYVNGQGQINPYHWIKQNAEHAAYIRGFRAAQSFHEIFSRRVNAQRVLDALGSKSAAA